MTNNFRCDKRYMLDYLLRATQRLLFTTETHIDLIKQKKNDKHVIDDQSHLKPKFNVEIMQLKHSQSQWMRPQFRLLKH